LRFAVWNNVTKKNQSKGVVVDRLSDLFPEIPNKLVVRTSLHFIFC